MAETYVLKEIHHRVKNNMQIISSLLNLQSNQIKDKKLIGIFEECQNRIKSMSLIHEELYQTKDLANSIFSSYSVSSDRVLLSVSVDNVFLSVDTAIPCGLIINELLTNSLKYAFPALIENSEQKPEDNAQSGRKGEIRINFHSENNKLTLIYSDNGIGLPEDFDLKITDTLGMELVNILTDQLNGNIEINRSKGTEFKIVFEV